MPCSMLCTRGVQSSPLSSPVANALQRLPQAQHSTAQRTRSRGYSIRPVPVLAPPSAFQPIHPDFCSISFPSSRKARTRGEKKKKRSPFRSRWPPALRCRYRRPGPFPKLRSHKIPGPGPWFWFPWEDLRCSASTLLLFLSLLSASIFNKKERRRRSSSSCCHGVVRDLKDASAARGRWW